MKVYLYGMKNRARDCKNYLVNGYVRDLYLEEMTCDMRDEYYNVLCYEESLDNDLIYIFDYEYIGTKDIEREQADEEKKGAKMILKVNFKNGSSRNFVIDDYYISDNDICLYMRKDDRQVGMINLCEVRYFFVEEEGV